MTTNASTLPALSTAAAILENLPSARFAVAYGSHARGRAAANSDLDLLYVFDEQPGPSVVRYLVSRVERLHATHRLDLDDEVAYDLKLWTTRTDLRQAIDLVGFSAPRGGLAVTTVPTDPVYINSPGFKARLTLNALTSPHVFLGGDPAAHQHAVSAAARAIARLALLAARDKTLYGVHELIDVLITDPATGATGQDWLGYETHDGPHLYALLATHLHQRRRHGPARPPKRKPRQ